MDYLLRLFSLCLVAGLISISPVKADEQDDPSQPALKEWTLLVFLNGNNNLDTFGYQDMNEMEKVGSTSEVNVVVQWGSLRTKKVTRILVQKDSDSVNVTSPIVEDLGKVDMGSPTTLVDFVKWAQVRYPAKRYLVDVWNHGGGWHRVRVGGEAMRDVSWDDLTGNSISTEELGVAIHEISESLGQPLDIFSSDSCLMGMAEVAAQMKGVVDVFAASQETEPGPGWPYDKWLERLVAKPTATAEENAIMLTETYVASYQGGTQGTKEVTFSAIKMSALESLEAAVQSFGTKISALNEAGYAGVRTAIAQSRKFYYSDYVDIGDLMKKIKGQTVIATEEVTAAADAVTEALNSLIVVNGVTPGYKAATGLSIWAPGGRSTYARYQKRYDALEFNIATDWSKALNAVLPRTE